MPDDISDLLSDALALPLEQRARLITSLIASLEMEDETASPPEIEAAWKAEIERRDAELESDPDLAIPSDAVFAEAERQLQDIRALRKRPA
jgi:putative addiction module component (TIGR02574 family)